MIQQIKEWLSIPRLLKTIDRLEKREVELQEIAGILLQHLTEERDKRMTLDDLKLKPEQRTELLNMASTVRQALFDAGEHICLTEEKDCCRKTAIKLRRYYMSLTLNPTKQNQIPSDRTYIDDLNERRAKMFTKPDAPTR